MKNAVLWDIKPQFVLHRRHITSPLQSPAGYYYVRFEAFTAVTVKSAVLWDITPCDSCTNRRSCLCSVLRLLVTANIAPSSLIHPDDGYDTFLRNVGSYKSHTSSHLMRWHSSLLFVSPDF
jgi:hypothetical protein